MPEKPSPLTLTVSLSDDEKAQLQALAESEHRSTAKQQASWMAEEYLRLRLKQLARASQNGHRRAKVSGLDGV